MLGLTLSQVFCDRVQSGIVAGKWVQVLIRIADDTCGCI